jgi:hypothetical protein
MGILAMKKIFYGVKLENISFFNSGIYFIVRNLSLSRICVLRNEPTISCMLCKTLLKTYVFSTPMEFFLKFS